MILDSLFAKLYGYYKVTHNANFIKFAKCI